MERNKYYAISITIDKNLRPEVVRKFASEILEIQKANLDEVIIASDVNAIMNMSFEEGLIFSLFTSKNRINELLSNPHYKCLNLKDCSDYLIQTISEKEKELWTKHSKDVFLKKLSSAQEDYLIYDKKNLFPLCFSTNKKLNGYKRLLLIEVREEYAVKMLIENGVEIWSEEQVTSMINERNTKNIWQYFVKWVKDLFEKN